ncbi:probable flap endonuclease 1 homolog [Cottoperca gobio]|uniref:Probable flap endonuclease 1 homolog n=1 Tax=Cottoperca gobio TaxID=56716 RepID=A0A6J2RF64_COTGO|nr:probable flap endonuclease 1 homolog [Cottoperca gobio]
MGITKLSDLIRMSAPGAVSHKDISDYTGKVIALDTSIVMNQFRAVTPALSPLTGLFFRTLTFLEHDIKPVFVFDGKPPEEKKAVLEKRAETAGWSSTNCTGTASSQTRDCLQLLKLLGVPVIQAPGDAEALCARLVREGAVDAVASEDMDTLPFGANILIRQLNAKRDSEVVEYSLPKLLENLQISHEEFVDMCILLGCDYCDKIAGLGPKRALTLIQKHRTIENVVLHINRQTHPVPHFWKYKEARKIFLDASQTVAPELTWTEPDEEALVRLLCHVKYVKEDRVRRRMEKFRQTRESKREEREKERAAGCSKQTRMEDFFRVTRKREQPVEVADSVSSNRKRPKSK